ncbi:MAG TPA: hypothetical protein VF490_02425 [Chryseosolibacter sp.]
MVEYSHSIITQIREAADETALQDIIGTSVRDLQSKRRSSATTKRRFMLNLIMALRYLVAEGLPPRERKNVSKAIEILENKRKDEQENLF